MRVSRVCNNAVRYLRNSIEGGKVAEYCICKKTQFSNQGYFQVDWEASRLAIKSSPVSRRHLMTKFKYGMCGTGEMIKIWKQRLVNNCPRCGKAKETTTHILKCGGTVSKLVFS